MTERRAIQTVYDKDGPYAFITKLISEHPKLAQYAMKKIAAEIIKRAKANIRNGRAEWPALWRDEIGSGVGHWTPEFNDRDDEYRRRSEESARGHDKPLQNSGELLKSIKLLTAGSSANKAYATVGSTAPHAAAHEYGRKTNAWVNYAGESLKPLPARPFLTPAVLSVKNSSYFKKKIRQEIVMLMKKSKNGEIKLPHIPMPK